MPKYIADTLYAIGETRLPRKASGVDTDDMQYLKGMSEVAQRLQDRELYAFDASAIRAAADLRIDTPERVDRLVSAVFAEPRSLFIEVDVEARDKAMRNLEGFFGHLQDGREPAQRFGVFVDIMGGGKAAVYPVWMHSRDVAREDLVLKERSKVFRSYPSSIHSALSQAMCISVSPYYGFMDISKHVGMARSEFDMVLKRAAPGFDPLLDRARGEMRKVEGVRAKGRKADDFWRIMRFRDIVQKFPDDRQHLGPVGKMVQDLYPNEMFDPVEIGLHVVAMCAVLQADTEDITREVRVRSGSGKKGSSGSRSGSGEKQIGGMSVVSLNILEEFREVYERGEFAGAESMSSSGVSGGRVRHPVRGHLFLARNGKVLWRKPHWRGSLDGSVLRKVVAPGFKEPVD